MPRALRQIQLRSRPRELAESELFGHEKGFHRRPGPEDRKFEEADGGTLFLDEIGNSPAVQAKLLRILQTANSKGGSNHT